MFWKAAPPLSSNNVELGWKGENRGGREVTLQKVHGKGPALPHWKWEVLMQSFYGHSRTRFKGKKNLVTIAEQALFSCFIDLNKPRCILWKEKNFNASRHSFCCITSTTILKPIFCYELCWYSGVGLYQQPIFIKSHLESFAHCRKNQCYASETNCSLQFCTWQQPRSKEPDSPLSSCTIYK